MKKIVVLGCGRVGVLMVKDLARRPGLKVTAVDASSKNLAGLKPLKSIVTRKADLSDKKTVGKLVKGCDLAVGAVPGWMGFAVMKSVIDAGVNYSDISFFPEDPFKLDARARAKGVTAVVDCGVAPGLSNMIVGHVDSILDKTQKVLILVGGLPKKRTLPWEYKAPFSPADVIEEYTRPARFVRKGKVVTVPALTDVELVKLPGAGTLEAFNTDGLRSIMRTIKAPDMKEKTLRYPGHADKMRLLRDGGFFDKKKVKVGDVKVRPLDVTSSLLFPQWQLDENEDEFTVMQVTVEGRKDKKHLRYTYNLLDRFDKKTGDTSMARTTGYPNAIVAWLLATGRFERKGVCPPEYIGCDEKVFPLILRELKTRGIKLKRKIEEI